MAALIDEPDESPVTAAGSCDASTKAQKSEFAISIGTLDKLMHIEEKARDIVLALRVTQPSQTSSQYYADTALTYNEAMQNLAFIRKFMSFLIGDIDKTIEEATQMNVPPLPMSRANE